MATEEITTLLQPRPMSYFVETPFVRGIVQRSLAYIKAGFPIHFRGPAGSGKTTLAMHIANLIGRSVVLIHGDEEFSTSDLVGGEYGYSFRKVRDNFIHSVLKTEEDMQRRWVDNRLTTACKYGYTLIYDEFTRSRPEANNCLLSIFQEKILSLPLIRGEDGDYMKVHPDFTAMLTSNPEEYAGVFKSQDALRDRMITVDLEGYDEETEVAITQARSGLARHEVEKIVRLVRELRESGGNFTPTVRACIMIAKTLKVRNGSVDPSSKIFREICFDILTSDTQMTGKKNSRNDTLTHLIEKHCTVPVLVKMKRESVRVPVASGGSDADGD